jgi:hypothetical protein
MDFSEPKKNVRMSPYRNYEVEVIDNKTLAIYFEPELNPVNKNSFTVQSGLHSLLGEELKQDYEFTFTDWKSGFELSELFMLHNVECYIEEIGMPVDRLGERVQVGTEVYEGEWITDFTFRFNAQLDLTAALDALSKIRVIPDDDRIKKPPYLQEIGLYSLEYDQTWAGMEYGTIEDPYRYLLIIPSGIDGVHNGKGQYLKENITVMLDVIDWDEIDPYKD